MTKKEAIEILNGAEIMVLNRDFEKFNQAIILAISSLQSDSQKDRGANE